MTRRDSARRRQDRPLLASLGIPPKLPTRDTASAQLASAFSLIPHSTSGSTRPPVQRRAPSLPPPTSRPSFSARPRLIAFAAVSPAPTLSPAAPDFTHDVGPIFATHCIGCHGPKKSKRGYRLDAKSVALTGGEGSAPNILPGHGTISPLVKFISGEVEDLKMPPKGDPLAPTEIAPIRAEIDAGPVWPDSASVALADPLDR